MLLSFDFAPSLYTYAVYACLADFSFLLFSSGTWFNFDLYVHAKAPFFLLINLHFYLTNSLLLTIYFTSIPKIKKIEI